jgi:cytochrome c oxidase assembly factor CtaG
MSPTLDAFLRSWPFDPWLTAALLVSAAIYFRGWLVLHRQSVERWHCGRLAAFLAGLAAIFLALASPLDAFASLLLGIHMVQHLLLMMVAPPLIWLGAPMFPLLRGLPAPIRAYWALPLLQSRQLRHSLTWLSQPWVAWPIFVGTTWLWHMPRCYELALSRSNWHFAEHLSFVAAALLFWYPVVRPYPSRPRWSAWLLFPYLILADVQNTLLAAWLTFSGDVLYPHYARVPRLAGLSALDDQALAGVLMWVPGSIAFLLPLFWIGVRLLFGAPHARQRPRSVAARPRFVASALLPVVDSRQPAARRRRFDLLEVPAIGGLLRSRLFRPAMQSLLAVLAAATIYDGLCGPQLSPLNLAGVLPWIHWRGLVILGLLVAGNMFCLACPFTLPRKLARRLLGGGRRWPRALRSKWLAVALTLLFLWSYDAFSLWDSPWLTAWIALGYFTAAFLVDGFFGGASFCKHVCPIGQFNFVQSLVSPLEVSVREPAVCANCRTRECIRGTNLISGCELQLFQPHKQGNLDCTFCLDCIRACPHENVGVLAVVPAATLWSDPLRSGIGRFSRRPDLAALVLVLVFGAFANAAGMVGPVVEWQQRLRVLLGNPPQSVVTTIYYFAAMILLPLLAVSGAARLSRASGKADDRRLAVATRYSFALIPIGFGMWLAHYSFHFLTSCETIVPAVQRFSVDLGWSVLGQPLWQSACCQPAAGWITHFEIVLLECGLLLSLYTGLRIAETQATRAVQAIKAVAPWAVLIVLLFAFGVWIVFQPMQMRGTLPAGG